jgi:hypothetical protein
MDAQPLALLTTHRGKCTLGKHRSRPPQRLTPNTPPAQGVLGVSHRSGPRQSGSLGCLCAAYRWAPPLPLQV